MITSIAQKFLSSIVYSFSLQRFCDQQIVYKKPSVCWAYHPLPVFLLSSKSLCIYEMHIFNLLFGSNVVNIPWEKKQVHISSLSIFSVSRVQCCDSQGFKTLFYYKCSNVFFLSWSIGLNSATPTFLRVKNTLL